MSKRRRSRNQTRPPRPARDPQRHIARRPPPSRRDEERRRALIRVVGGVVIAALGLLALVFLVLPAIQPAATPPAAETTPAVAPPDATPLAQPPAEPASDGTRATIETELGEIVIELFTDSAPVAAQNFINLAEAGFYEGVTFHRIVPDFVIQGGDPRGDGTGGPEYSIPDEPVVGEYGRGIVAMARTQAPDSAGSQFFIVLDDQARDALEFYRTYVIFGRVVDGMDVADEIGGMANSGPPDNRALEPVAMLRVTVGRP
ncbi:MAG TPA: peptidylprolyl isomerase [Candidatus Limnocylindria bacterium]|nr:peptidylprolyl isomerase [Candidatus Limnocylindria bacterium]